MPFNIKLSHLRPVLLLAVLLGSGVSFSQPTNFFNGGVDITVYPSTILYVDGHVRNEPAGFIHNQGDIYLTGDWTNNEPLGLDANTGTVILYGTNQLITGSATTTFNNLDCQVTGTKTLNINTVVGGTSGVLSLNFSKLDLNSKTCTVTNPLNSAITRTSGYIISETDSGPGYGRLQWNLANSTGTYTIPFGTTTSEYIPFIYNVTAAGTQSTAGNVSVATYPTSVTSSPNNRPLPAGVSDLNDESANEAADSCADRFWVMDVNNYSTNPMANLSFTYRDIEWDASGGSTNSIVEDSLGGWMWDGTQWQNPPLGGANTIANTVTVLDVDYSAPWTLKAKKTKVEGCGDFTVPNAFSPNNDGHNDLFVLHGWNNCVSDFSFLIFDRWGEKVFESENPAKSWDGYYRGKTLDPNVFVYYLNAKLNSGEKVSRKGNISLIK